MQYIKGMINPNVLYELGNRFGWIPKHPMGLNALTTGQKRYAVQLNRRYVATMKGIMPLNEFQALWNKGGAKALISIPNLYIPGVTELEHTTFNIQKDIMSLEGFPVPYKAKVRFVYNPYKNVFNLVQTSLVIWANPLEMYGLKSEYLPEEMEAALSLIETLV